MLDMLPAIASGTRVRSAWRSWWANGSVNIATRVGNGIAAVAFDSENKTVAIAFGTLPDVIAKTLDVLEMADLIGTCTTAAATVWIVRPDNA